MDKAGCLIITNNRGVVMVKRLSVIVCCFILAGCATGQRGANPEMQSRIASLEDEVKAKDLEIGSMRDELRQVRQQSAMRSDTSEFSAKRKSNITPAKPRETKTQSDDIIKVDGVSPSQVQQALKKAGVYNGKVDGKMGPKTKQAIKSFQRKNKMKADGIVGSGTWAKLKINL
jgi:murein L,D-transpeptidase YcbB/YkuD